MEGVRHPPRTSRQYTVRRTRLVLSGRMVSCLLSASERAVSPNGCFGSGSGDFEVSDVDTEQRWGAGRGTERTVEGK